MHAGVLHSRVRRLGREFGDFFDRRPDDLFVAH
jgi:hypothetical protein